MVSRSVWQFSTSAARWLCLAPMYAVGFSPCPQKRGGEQVHVGPHTPTQAPLCLPASQKPRQQSCLFPEGGCLHSQGHLSEMHPARGPELQELREHPTAIMNPVSLTY